MASVGLLYVGAVLFLNGLMLLGWVNPKSVIPLNLFVGVLQVVTPTYLIFTSGGDSATILNASGLYLFGFTYLYVAMNQWMNLDGTGLGYFSLFVALCALVYSGLNFSQLDDNAFGVIWLLWAFLWTLFFLVLGLGKEVLGRYTGAVCALQGIITGAVPAFILLTGHWVGANTAVAISIAIFSVVAFGLLFPALGRRPVPAASKAGAVGEPVR